jgi:hypothetical protein
VARICRALPTGHPLYAQTLQGLPGIFGTRDDELIVDPADTLGLKGSLASDIAFGPEVHRPGQGHDALVDGDVDLLGHPLQLGVRRQEVLDTLRNRRIRVSLNIHRPIVHNIAKALNARRHIRRIQLRKGIIDVSCECYNAVVAPDAQAPWGQKRIRGQLLSDVALEVGIVALRRAYCQPVRDPDDPDHILGRLLREALLVQGWDTPVQRDLALLHVYRHLGGRQTLIRCKGIAHCRGELGVGGSGALLLRAHGLPPYYLEVVGDPNHIPDQARLITGALLLIGDAYLIKAVADEHPFLPFGGGGGTFLLEFELQLLHQRVV